MKLMKEKLKKNFKRSHSLEFQNYTETNRPEQEEFFTKKLFVFVLEPIQAASEAKSVSVLHEYIVDNYLTSLEKKYLKKPNYWK